ncbi:hypothetical protein [Psychromicrobium lacuslunae]|uniref:Uncharacterized protein n=1 Tax=Psychromicrobium lacuslunae TaxID=1618207 RepID=A0A0D4C0Z5_9MICC|nr:hypothetical protein [Psychromicrobium lacuslunae]AJT42229.1 hypothetical protein UM93_13305 [Psychromicrobium lacuslunae]
MQRFLASRRLRLAERGRGATKLAILAALLGLCFLLASCSNSNPQPGPSSSTSPSVDLSKPNPSASSLPSRTDPLIDPSGASDECAIFSKLGELTKQGYYTSVAQTRSEIKPRLDIMQRTFSKLAKVSDKGSGWQPVADAAKKASDAFVVYGQDVGNSSFLVELAKFNAELTKALTANKDRIETSCQLKYSDLGLG